MEFNQREKVEKLGYVVRASVAVSPSLDSHTAVVFDAAKASRMHSLASYQPVRMVSPNLDFF